MSEERGLVEVPENAMRDDPLAFGLTAPQLGLAGAAAAVAFILNLLPIWLPLRLTLAVLVAAPIFGVAVISIRGEPGYRWLMRFARFARSERRWFVATPATGDPTGEPDLPEQPVTVNTNQPTERFEFEAASDPEPTAALPRGPSPMWDKSVRLRVVAGETDEPSPSEVRPPELAAPDTPILPHLVGDSRLVCFLSFAGGVGKTTLAVETASSGRQDRPPTAPRTVRRGQSGSSSSMPPGSLLRRRSVSACRPRTSRPPGRQMHGASRRPRAASLSARATASTF